jgi:hypothetical protein
LIDNFLNVVSEVADAHRHFLVDTYFTVDDLFGRHLFRFYLLHMQLVEIIPLVEYVQSCVPVLQNRLFEGLITHFGTRLKVFEVLDGEGREDLVQK